MKITPQGDTLTITEVPELCTLNSDAFRSQVCQALPSSVKAIEVDLSQTRYIDSCGLGALIGVYKTATRSHGTVSLRVVNPAPSVQQMFELTRLHRVFEIVQR